MLIKLFWIGCAGALGTLARHLIGIWASERFGPGFPYGTLLVNVSGCLLMGALMQTAINISNFPPTLRLALTTGLMGGLTTYSSFAYETVALARAGSRGAALFNFGVTSIACTLAVLLGLGAAQLWSAPAPR